MNSKQIDYCIELAHTLNFSRAAENMYVSQPTFSYQIKLLEEEIGFALFERSGKGASLTPAGAQFIGFLVNMREELKRAVEQGQNFSARYRDSIAVGAGTRQSLFFLPDAIRQFEKEQPEIQIKPVFRYGDGLNSFLRNEIDIQFALKEQTKHIPGISVHELFMSRIYLIAPLDDPLAKKDLIREEDLYGRTLMVGGGSPPALRTVQNRMISTGRIQYFNSADHDTTIVNLASGHGVCLAPGFLNDHSGLYAWIPFDCPEHFDCVLCTHKEDKRESVLAFVRILQKLYKEAVAFPL